MMPPKSTLLPSTWEFLQQVEANNQRDWFQAHKDEYQAAMANAHAFVDELILLMNHHDHIENTSGKSTVYRFHSDLRFDKNKPPYNPRLAFSLQRSGRTRRGGYYMHIKPGNTYLACGFFGPNAEDLRRIRQDIAQNFEEWEALLGDAKLRENVGEMRGDAVKTAPRGFEIDTPGIALIRHKQFFFRRDFEDHEVLQPGFVAQVDAIFQMIRPFFDYMSEMLSTNANGESIL